MELFSRDAPLAERVLAQVDAWLAASAPPVRVSQPICGFEVTRQQGARPKATGACPQTKAALELLRSQPPIYVARRVAAAGVRHRPILRAPDGPARIRTIRAGDRSDPEAGAARLGLVLLHGDTRIEETSTSDAHLLSVEARAEHVRTILVQVWGDHPWAGSAVLLVWVHGELSLYLSRDSLVPAPIAPKLPCPRDGHGWHPTRIEELRGVVRRLVIDDHVERGAQTAAAVARCVIALRGVRPREAKAAVRDAALGFVAPAAVLLHPGNVLRDDVDADGLLAPVLAAAPEPPAPRRGPVDDVTEATWRALDERPFDDAAAIVQAVHDALATALSWAGTQDPAAMRGLRRRCAERFLTLMRRSRAPCAIVTDVDPGLTGWDVVQWYRASWARYARKRPSRCATCANTQCPLRVAAE